MDAKVAVLEPRTEVDQIRGILNQFDPDQVGQAVDSYFATHPMGAFKTKRDFPDPGPEIAIGKESNVALESRFERIIGVPNFLPASFLEEGVVRQKAVARLPRITPNNPMGTPWGTGFLVSNSLIMTNNHVIPTVAEAKTIMSQFNYQTDMNGVAQSIDTWYLDPDSFFHTSVALDYTLVRVKGRPFFLTTPFKATGGEDMTLTTAILQQLTSPYVKQLDPNILRPLLRFPGFTWGHLQLNKTIGYSIGECLNVVQHPAGRMKEVALQQNEITHLYTNVVHYKTDTEPGSSGSAVFNNQWDLVALHHAAGDPGPNNTWLDNEGMRIDKIVADLRAQFATSKPELLQELGIQ